MRLTLLTAACNRPAAWKLCEMYMKRQTVQPFQWLVLDDDEPQTVCTMGQEYFYKPEFKGPDSLKNKVRFAITSRLIKGDAVCFWENDDWMAPTWLEFCQKQLQTYDMIGEGRAIYYNIKQRFWVQHSNMQHASLCATAIKTSMLNFVSASCSNPDRWIDDMLWSKPGLNKKVFDPKHTNGGKPLTVGIKGMPGRTGYGLQHVMRPSDAKDDPNLEYLRYLIGDDAEFYKPFGERKTLQDIYSKYCLFEHGISDKGTTHSYIEEYEKLFAPFRDRQPVRVLEIGLCRGGSLRMWHDFFDKSEVHGIDISDAPDGFPDLKRLINEKLPRMTISIADARNQEQVQKMIGQTKFDIIIEDANHDIQDSISIYSHFINRLNPGGLYIIEDVADIDNSLPLLQSSITRPFEVLDFRKQKNRFDDVLVVIK